MKISVKDFEISKKNEIIDENGNIKYWCQPDFSYKKRLHVYNSDNNEIGYVQYKVISLQSDVEYFDAADNKLDYSEYTFVEEKDSSFVVLYDGNKIATVCNDTFEINDREDECLLFIFGNIGE